MTFKTIFISFELIQLSFTANPFFKIPKSLCPAKLTDNDLYMFAYVCYSSVNVNGFVYQDFETCNGIEEVAGLIRSRQVDESLR